MEGISLINLLFVAIVAFLVPFVLGFIPRLRLPASVAEVLVGVVLGPSVLGWIEIDESVAIFASIGVAFLLLLAGMDIDLEALRGRPGRLGAIGFVLSLAIALGIELVFSAEHLVLTPFLVAVALTSTSVGIVVPTLRDMGLLDTPLGTYVLASGTVAEFGAIVLLGVFFAKPESSPLGEAILLVVLAGLALLLLWALSRVSLNASSRAVFRSLRDTSAQLAVRLAFVLLLAGLIVTGAFGFEQILGAFLAGIVLSLISTEWGDIDRFKEKLEGAGFGLFIPAFFITIGLGLDLRDLEPTFFEVGRVLVLLLVLLVARGVPTLLYRSELPSGRHVVAAGLLQATNFQFIVVAVEVGRRLDRITVGGGEALIVAGLLSAVLFPPIALRLVARDASEAGAMTEG